jgi:hypothetical protein
LPGYPPPSRKLLPRKRKAGVASFVQIFVRTQKTKSPPQGYSVNRLSELTGADRRTINKAIATNEIAHVGMDGNAKLYAIADIEAALAKKSDKSLKDEKLSEEIRKLRIKNDRDEGKLVLKSAVVQTVVEWEGEESPIIEQKLEREWPASVASTPEDVPRVRMFGMQLNDTIRACNRKLIKKLQALGV